MLYLTHKPTPYVTYAVETYDENNIDDENLYEDDYYSSDNLLSQIDRLKRLKIRKHLEYEEAEKRYIDKELKEDESQQISNQRILARQQEQRYLYNQMTNENPKAMYFMMQQ